MLHQRTPDRPPMRRYALVLVAGLLALGLVACTGDGDPGSGPATTTAAAKYADANALADAIEASLAPAGAAKVSRPTGADVVGLCTTPLAVKQVAPAGHSGSAPGTVRDDSPLPEGSTTATSPVALSVIRA